MLKIEDSIVFYYTLAFKTTYPVMFYDIFLRVNVALKFWGKTFLLL